MLFRKGHPSLHIVIQSFVINIFFLPGSVTTEHRACGEEVGGGSRQAGRSEAGCCAVTDPACGAILSTRAEVRRIPKAGTED